jgi:hypothetical protein
VPHPIRRARFQVPRPDLRNPVLQQIRESALAENDGPEGRALPLAGLWNSGLTAAGFTPAYQLEQIRAGHRLLPSFYMSDLNATQFGLSYYQSALQTLAGWKLPITFIGGQWESVLYTDNTYYNLPPDQNPNVTPLLGPIQKKVSPFGPASGWQAVGQRQGSAPLLSQLQAIYPDPPFILWVANNEAQKLRWTEIDQDLRWATVPGDHTDPLLKVATVGGGWIARYPALLQAIRSGLSAPGWRSVSRFIGFNAFGPSYLARWIDWRTYALALPGRIDPNPLMWEGGSTAAYVSNSSPITDYQVFSPQVECQNQVFMQAEAWALNPDFWLEVSFWDGHTTDASDKRATYQSQGQTFSPERYAGMVRFIAWVLRPRVVREFRFAAETVADEGAYFAAVMEVVDEVYSRPLLKQFWQKGRLLANEEHLHPYQADVPVDYQGAARWFMLDTSLDPPRPWQLSARLPVFAVALEIGAAPRRQWMVYAHAPLGERQGVQVQIPGGPVVEVTVPVGGGFWSFDEGK